MHHQAGTLTVIRLHSLASKYVVFVPYATRHVYRISYVTNTYLYLYISLYLCIYMSI